MLRLKMSLVILIIIFLSGCRTPEIRDLEQKNLKLVLSVDTESGRRYINEDESVCFTRMYKHSKGYVGPIGQEHDNDITYCNDLIGYGPSEYVDLSLFFEEVRVEVNRPEENSK